MVMSAIDVANNSIPLGWNNSVAPTGGVDELTHTQVFVHALKLVPAVVACKIVRPRCQVLLQEINHILEIKHKK